MPLLTGSDPSALTELVLDGFRASLRADAPRMRIVVPTKTLEQHLQNRLAREGLVFRPDRIQTLSGFIEPLATAPVETRPKTISEAGLQLIVQSAVARLARPEFAKVAEMPGFHGALARTLHDLDTAGCALNTLERNLDHAPLGAALLAVWREVESEMRRRGWITRAGALRAAAERVALQDANAGEGAGETVAFDGFASFSDPELSVVEAIARRAEVTVTLPDADFSRAARSRLLAMGFHERVLEEEPRDAVRVSVTAPENIEREVDEIARRILLEHATGTPFREMGVILRDRNAYASLLESTLERFGIPARFYFEAPLDEHPAARFVVGLMDARLAGWDHEIAIAALRLAPKTGVSSAMDRLDIEVRKWLPMRGFPALLELAAPGDDRLLQLLENCRTGLKDLPNARDLFRPGQIPDGVSWSDAFIYRGQAAALEAIENAIEEASAWHAVDPKPASIATVWRTAKTILSLTPLRVPDNRRNVVHVLSAYEARQWKLSVVIVPGLIEGQFPKRHPQNAFLPDIAIARLQRAGIRLRTSEDRDREERFLFDSAIARATGSAILSYPRAEAHGEPTVPSTFVASKTVAEAPVKVRPDAAIASAKVRDTGRPPVALSSPDLLRVLHAQHASFSASSLESYLQCPFQFFALKTLRLAEFPPPPEERLNFLELGNLAHSFLAEWFVARPPVEPLFDRLFAEICARLRVPRGYRTEMWRHRILQDLQRFCDRDEWPRHEAVVETEVKFSFQLNESIAVGGKIDRLERLPDGSGIVVDYKYSPGATTKKLIGDETRLQAPIYLLAIERAFGLRPAAMAYYSLRGDPKPYGRGEVAGLSERWEPLTRQWLDDAAAKIVESVGNLREGRIFAAPAALDPCRYCDARDICRYEAAAGLTASGE